MLLSAELWGKYDDVIKIRKIAHYGLIWNSQECTRRWTGLLRRLLQNPGEKLYICLGISKEREKMRLWKSKCYCVQHLAKFQWVIFTGAARFVQCVVLLVTNVKTFHANCKSHVHWRDFLTLHYYMYTYIYGIFLMGHEAWNTNRNHIVR